MPEGDINSVVDFINRILELSDLRLEAAVEPVGEAIKVQVRGEDRALLLGHNAELLDALEYLGNRIFARAADEDKHLIFDSGSYRAQREKELRLMAEKAAEKVRASRIPFTFDPMTPNERRIIHLALAEDTTVRSESQGNGENRKVTIFPAK
ncbi:MAG: R3H domain-containing nucleic acid-binding protein [Blastocatellia bacterium]